MDVLQRLFSNAFISSMAGVIIGGLITFLTSLIVSKKQFKYGLLLEESKEYRQNIKALNTVLSELHNNLAIAGYAKKNLNHEGKISIRASDHPFKHSSWESHNSQLYTIIEVDRLVDFDWFYYLTRIYCDINKDSIKETGETLDEYIRIGEAIINHLENLLVVETTKLNKITARIIR